MDLVSYGNAMNDIMDAHKQAMRRAYESFISEIRAVNAQTQTEIGRVTSSLIGNENGEAEHKTPTAIAGKIFK